MIYGLRDWNADERAAYARNDTPLADALGEVLKLRALLAASRASLEGICKDMDKAQDRKAAGLRVAPVDREALSAKLNALAEDMDPDA